MYYSEIYQDHKTKFIEDTHFCCMTGGEYVESQLVYDKDGTNWILKDKIVVDQYLEDFIGTPEYEKLKTELYKQL
jgi:hypothetical protein